MLGLLGWLPLLVLSLLTTGALDPGRPPAIASAVPVDPAAVLRVLRLDPADPRAQALVLVAQRFALDPLLGHLILVEHRPYITRDGYLAVAHRSGVFDGMVADDLWYLEGPRGDGVEAAVPDGAGCWFARVSVHRSDMTHPFTAVAWAPVSERVPTDPRDLALARAERRALRRAFAVGLADDFDAPEPPLEVDAEKPQVTSPHPDAIAPVENRSWGNDQAPPLAVPPPPAPSEDTERTLSQLRFLFALLRGGLRIDDDDARHAWAATVLHRPVTTFTDLDRHELGALITAARIAAGERIEP